jgi:hypothetical protein
MREEKMKKQVIILFAFAIVSFISLTSCEPFIENKVTVRNLAAAPIHLNIRAQLYDVAPGETLVLSDFKKGTFEFETIYSVPSVAQNFSAEGDVAGEMVLNGGTEVLLVYSSTLVDVDYTVFGSMTTTDDVDRVDPFDDSGSE